MIHPPNQFLPGGTTVYNGDPTRSADLRHVDTYSAYLAATHKTLSPARVGDYTNATGAPYENTYKWREWVPAYTLYQGFKIWYVGWGQITITNSVDGYNTTIPIWAHLDDYFGKVRYVELMTPVDADANGEARALKVTATTAPKTVDYTMVLGDLGYGFTLGEFETPTLTVKTLRIVSLPPADDYTLP